jgi:integrase/recombinase XerD
MNVLKKAVRDYFRMRRSLGYQLKDPEYYLQQFVAFLQKKGSSRITSHLALEWAKKSECANPAHWARRLGAVRRFAEYRKVFDARTEVPPPGLLPHKYRRTPPYIYKQAEILRVLRATRHLPPSGALRRWTYSTLFGLLAVTGLRGREARALKRDEVDLKRGLLSVHRTKFGKSRFVPIAPSVVRALARYARKRDDLIPHPKSPTFFILDRGVAVSKGISEWTFRKVSHQVGLRGPDDRTGPRLHDFRHGFAVKTLLGWYRAGLDVERMMPHLSTYLGHTHAAHTYWYLSAVPELLALASKRLENTLGELP